MKLDLPSFALGCAVGAGTTLLSPRLKPLLLEIATVGYRSAEALASRVGVAREDLEDILAEARARVRGSQPSTPPPGASPHPVA
jgi:hypothetical protein